MNNSFEKTNIFGYPDKCEHCKENKEWKGLKVTGAYYKPGTGKKLMLIGQDPTIRKDSDRVNVPLMLDDENSQISKWLKGIVGADFDTMIIYATNLVKCTFDMPPSNQEIGGLKFLDGYFKQCSKYLLAEIENYKPDLVITLGEPAHIYLMELLKFGNEHTMKKDFDGKFDIITTPKCHEFKYSPCLHIQTFRVAETYGEKVKEFKQGLKDILTKP